MKANILIDVIMKLNGDIVPLGQSHTDTERLENLNNLIKVVSELLIKIDGVSMYYLSHQHSLKEAGSCAAEFLKGIGYKTEQ